MKKIIAVLLSLWMAGPAFADQTINSLTAGSALTGSELIPMFQSANPAVTTSPNAIKTFLGNATNGAKGLVQCDGTTLNCSSGVASTAAALLTGGQTITAAQWAAGDTIRITTAAQTITMPSAATLSVNGGLVIQTFGQSVTVAPNGTDNINGANANLTIPAGKTVLATTDGSANIWIPIDGGVIIGAPVTGTCTSGFNISNNSGVVGCQANGGGGGTVTTTGSPASGNLAKFSGASSITNGDLSGDCTTSGTLAITCTKTSGTAFAASATTDTTNASNIGSGTLNIARLPSGLVGSIPISWDSTTTVANATIPIANPQWSSGGTITSVTYYTNGSATPSFTAAVQIGGTNVTSCSALSVSSSTATTTNCTAANTFTNSSQITLVISSVSGTPNQALVQINYTHGAN